LYKNEKSLRQIVPCGKICAEAQEFKRDKPSRNQGSGLPGRRDTDAAIAAVIPPVVDVEAALAEVADVDAATARIDGTGSNVDVLEQALASGEVVADDRVDHHLR